MRLFFKDPHRRGIIALAALAVFFIAVPLIAHEFPSQLVPLPQDQYQSTVEAVSARISQDATQKALGEAQVPAKAAELAKTPLAIPKSQITSGGGGGTPFTTGTVPDGKRLFMFVNNTNQTIWVAGSSNGGTAVQLTDGSGWELPAGQTISTYVSNHWNGRFWGRTGCTFSGSNGHCATGDCGGQLQCSISGSLPATLAEFNLNAANDDDFYDVSLVDGSNLPMYINNNGGDTADPISSKGCVPAGCTKDANATCLSMLEVKDSSGNIIGCDSSCTAFGTPQYCCTGAYYNAETCNPATWPIDSAAIFKAAEPFAYSFAYDDATSTLTCHGNCNYRITFGTSS